MSRSERKEGKKTQFNFQCYAELNAEILDPKEKSKCHLYCKSFVCYLIVCLCEKNPSLKWQNSADQWLLPRNHFNAWTHLIKCSGLFFFFFFFRRCRRRPQIKSYFTCRWCFDKGIDSDECIWLWLVEVLFCYWIGSNVSDFTFNEHKPHRETYRSTRKLIRHTHFLKKANSASRYEMVGEPCFHLYLWIKKKNNNNDNGNSSSRSSRSHHV